MSYVPKRTWDDYHEPRKQRSLGKGHKGGRKVTWNGCVILLVKKRAQFRTARGEGAIHAPMGRENAIDASPLHLTVVGWEQKQGEMQQMWKGARGDKRRHCRTQ